MHWAYTASLFVASLVAGLLLQGDLPGNLPGNWMTKLNNIALPALCWAVFILMLAALSRGVVWLIALMWGLGHA